MYTIKVVSINWIKGGVREVTDTMYLEAHGNVIFKILERNTNQNATAVVLDYITANKTSGGYNHNVNEESWFILVIDYELNTGELKTLFVYSSSEVYLMQNGKTIDKIII